MRLIPPHSSHLGRELDALTDPGGLLSPAGIRSLSQRSSLYSKHNTQHDPPYWRGTVWININYLVLDVRAPVEFDLFLKGGGGGLFGVGSHAFRVCRHPCGQGHSTQSH